VTLPLKKGLRMNRLFLFLFLVLFSGAAAAADGVCTIDRATGTTIDPQPLLRGAYGARWNFAAGRVALMDKGADGYYRVFTTRPDGSGAVYMPQVSGRHEGAPYWHPSGKYLLFVAQKRDWTGKPLFGNLDYEALPGFGRHDDIWIATSDGKQSWQLTHEPNTKDEGALLPVFSPDGKRVAWSARQPGGTYALQVADFVETPQPHLENIRSFMPGGKAYYETGSFSSDGQSLFYTGDQDTHSFWASQIYRLDLKDGTGTRLTTGKDYNEHPVCVKTPTGDWIVYMSTRGVKRLPFHFFLGTDWYAMKPDGSGTKRLTTMSAAKRDNPEYTGDLQVACAMAISPDGDYFIGDVQDDLKKQTGVVKIVHLTCGKTP
jgi:Tol biopolymer transport system component